MKRSQSDTGIWSNCFGLTILTRLPLSHPQPDATMNATQQVPLVGDRFSPDHDRPSDTYHSDHWSFYNPLLVVFSQQSHFFSWLLRHYAQDYVGHGDIAVQSGDFVQENSNIHPASLSVPPFLLVFCWLQSPNHPRNACVLLLR